MLGLLGDIWNAIRSVPYLIADLFVDLINGFIAGIAALATFLLNLLPSFPAAPEPPSSGVLGFLNWVVPLSPILAAFALLVTCWVTFSVIKIGLKWVKAL